MVDRDSIIRVNKKIYIPDDQTINRTIIYERLSMNWMELKKKNNEKQNKTIESLVK